MSIESLEDNVVFRLKKELRELTEKLSRLNDFMSSEEMRAVCFEQKHLIEEQFLNMHKYRLNLIYRICNYAGVGGGSVEVDNF